MGKKKEGEAKEKPLDKMTAKELREMALGLEGIFGVHSMNKAELIANIKQAKGIVDEVSKKKSVDIRAIKLKIQELRARRLQAKESGNNKLADALRRRIGNLKKRTRKAA